MDTLVFDEGGYLTPYDLILSDLPTIETVFVESFPALTTRRKLFDAFVTYLTELTTILKTPLEVWVNGSFTTQKHNPTDVDFVIFVDKQVAITHRDTIYQFRQRRYAKNSVTDGYFVEVVAENHPDYTLYQFDREDWHRAFVFGRNA